MGERIALRGLLVLALLGLLAGLQLPAASGAESASSLRAQAKALRAENGSLGSQARATWLSAVSIDTRLEQTRAALARLRDRTDVVARERAEAQLRLRVARRALVVSQKRLAQRLRLLYKQGEADPLAVVLGATSLSEAIEGLESLDRVAVQDKDYVRQARAAKSRLIGLTRVLAAREAEARRAADAVAATAAALAAARQERVALAARLAAQRRANSEQASSLDSEARALAAAQPAVPVGAAPSLPSAPSAGGSVLTVTATGYALSGKTATGVSVGWGVVAVDPAFILLGTHMTIPGYGEGVAADTGGAVRGARIDLWFPTEAEARAWGTRTVTITLH